MICVVGCQTPEEYELIAGLLPDVGVECFILCSDLVGSMVIYSETILIDYMSDLNVTQKVIMLCNSCVSSNPDGERCGRSKFDIA